MNLIAIVILAAVIIDIILNFTADILNLRNLKENVPLPFKNDYPQDQYQQSQRYLKVNTQFGWITGVFDLTVLLLFWFLGGFAWLDAWVRSLGMPMLVSGLIYIGVLIALKTLLAIPFDIYTTFIIEQRFGFNKTTWRTYILDRIKTIVIALILGTPLLAAVLFFFQYAGSNAWWFCWLLTVGFMMLVQYIAPAWIMPLFNRFDPLAAGPLREAILDYAHRINFKLDNIFVMDGSKRSSKTNAFFTGFGAHRRIVLFDTLVEKHSVDELVAVLAHEMGHYKERHILKNLLIGTAQSGLMFFILSFFISNQLLFNAFYVKQSSVYAGLIFFSMLYAPLDGLMGMAVQAMSRAHEYAADRFAVSTTGNKQAMINALKKLSVHNLSNLEPHTFYVFLNYSHPPILKRIEAIEMTDVERWQNA